MLNTMRAELNKEKSDVTFESLLMDQVTGMPVREAMLDAMGDTDPDPDIPDAEMEKLIETIPETDIDDPDVVDEVAKGEVGNGREKDGSTPKDEDGNDRKQTVDECIEAYIPDTNEE